MKMLTTKRPGYVFLMSVLVTGVVSMAVMVTFLLLSIGMQRSGLAFAQSKQALSYAQSCAEYGILALHENPNYPGSEVRNFTDGSCEILEVGGTGNNNRTICIEGTSVNAVRRLEILIEQLLPSVRIYAWQEVVNFTSCDY